MIIAAGQLINNFTTNLIYFCFHVFSQSLILLHCFRFSAVFFPRDHRFFPNWYNLSHMLLIGRNQQGTVKIAYFYTLTTVCPVGNFWVIHLAHVPGRFRRWVDCEFTAKPQKWASKPQKGRQQSRKNEQQSHGNRSNAATTMIDEATKMTFSSRLRHSLVASPLQNRQLRRLRYTNHMTCTNRM